MVVNTNELHHLRKSLEPLVGVARELEARVVVVDNASSDGSAEFLHERERERDAGSLTVIANERNRGYGPSMNIGAAHAPGHDVFVLNPDVQVDSADAVRRLWDFLRELPAAGIVAPRLLSPDGSVQSSVRPFPSVLAMAGHSSAARHLPIARRAAERYLSLPVGEEPRVVDWAIGAALLVNRSAWDAMGGFDERFFVYLEDVDLCLRCGRAGWQTWYVPGVALQHGYERASDPSRGWIASSAARRHHIASMLRFFSKHPRLAFRR